MGSCKDTEVRAHSRVRVFPSCLAKAHRPADGSEDGIVACRDDDVEDRKSSAVFALQPEEELDFAERGGTCLHESEVLGDFEAGDGRFRSDDEAPTGGARRRQKMRAAGRHVEVGRSTD